MRLMIAMATIAALTACGGPNADDGGVVYDRSCALCHGANGTGEPETGIDGAEDLSVLIPSLTDADITNTINNGTSDGDPDMLPVSLDDADIEDLLAFLRAEFDSAAE